LQAIEQRVRRTGVSAAWVAIIVSSVVLVLHLILILENLRDVTVTYLAPSGQLPLNVALLSRRSGRADRCGGRGHPLDPSAAECSPSAAPGHPPPQQAGPLTGECPTGSRARRKWIGFSQADPRTAQE